MGIPATEKLGHQSRSAALSVGKKFLDRTEPTLHCDTGLCYIGHNGVFPCRCEERLLRHLPDH